MGLHLKELLGLLQLERVLAGLLLSMVGGLGLVRDKAVVRDHDGGREDRRGDQDSVAVHLLHGKRWGHHLLLQGVFGLLDGCVALGSLGANTAIRYECLHWLVEQHA